MPHFRPSSKIFPALPRCDTTALPPPTAGGPRRDTGDDGDLQMTDLITSLETFIRQAPALTLVWITFVGGCVGSFMNVVVYRLPRGQSLLHPGSRCPRCHHSIRWYDNLPVFGWLRLRGHCRDCQTAISPRYPLVEGLMMLIFANQWMQDVSRVATDDPLGPAVFAFLWQMSLMCVLVTAALIDFDGHVLPKSLLIFGGTVPLVMTGVWPSGSAQLLHTEASARVWESVLGGAMLAALITFVLKPGFRRAHSQDAASGANPTWVTLALSAMSGLYLGSGRAVATLLLTTLLWRTAANDPNRTAGGRTLDVVPCSPLLDRRRGSFLIVP